MIIILGDYIVRLESVFDLYEVDNFVVEDGIVTIRFDSCWFEDVFQQAYNACSRLL